MTHIAEEIFPVMKSVSYPLADMFVTISSHDNEVDELSADMASREGRTPA